MKRKKVNSSNIKSVGYSAVDNILEVEFHSGGTYYYKGVSPEVHSKLVSSSSIGSSFFKLVKGKFSFVKGEYKETEVAIPNLFLCGPAGAGKTASANYLIKKMGYIQAKFAYPVYDIARNYFGMKNKDRLLLQTIGTDCAREAVSKDIWVTRFIEDTTIVKITRDKMGLPVTGLISDDVRFENEKLVLESNGWIGIFLNVPDSVRIERLKARDGNAQISTLDHSSEVDIDKFKDDLIQIDASGSLEKMYTSLDNLLETIKKGNTKV